MFTVKTIFLIAEFIRAKFIFIKYKLTTTPSQKKYGLASKARLKELIGGRSGPILKTQINKKGEDMRGKFGRILGDFVTDDGRMVTDILVEEGHAVAYFGGSKEEIGAKLNCT